MLLDPTNKDESLQWTEDSVVLKLWTVGCAGIVVCCSIFFLLLHFLGGTKLW